MTLNLTKTIANLTQATRENIITSQAEFAMEVNKH